MKEVRDMILKKWWNYCRRHGTSTNSRLMWTSTNKKTKRPSVTLTARLPKLSIIADEPSL